MSKIGQPELGYLPLISSIFPIFELTKINWSVLNFWNRKVSRKHVKIEYKIGQAELGYLPLNFF